MTTDHWAIQSVAPIERAEPRPITFAQGGQPMAGAATSECGVQRAYNPLCSARPDRRRRADDAVHARHPERRASPARSVGRTPRAKHLRDRSAGGAAMTMRPFRCPVSSRFLPIAPAKPRPPPKPKPQSGWSEPHAPVAVGKGHHAPGRRTCRGRDGPMARPDWYSGTTIYRSQTSDAVTVLACWRRLRGYDKRRFVVRVSARS